ncbi:hypothetical protein UlMin_014097 [Ulmus minor]
MITRSRQKEVSLKQTPPSPPPPPRSATVTARAPLPVGVSNQDENCVQRDVMRKVVPEMGICSEDCMDLDSIDSSACIRCNAKDEHVLACSGIGCALAVHEKCLGIEPDFDHLGKFCCPYCSYKHALERTRELRRKAMAAKKALLSFLDGTVAGINKEKDKGESDQRKEPNVLANAGDGNCCVDENGQTGVSCQFMGVEEDHRHVIESINNAQVGCRDQDRIETENEVRRNASVANNSGNADCRVGATVDVESLKDSMAKETLNKEGVSDMPQLESGEDVEDEQLKDLGPTNDGQHEGKVEENEKLEDLNVCHVAKEKTLDGAADGLNEVAEDGMRVSKENQVREEDGEHMQPEELDRAADANDKSETEDTSLAMLGRRFKRKAQKKALFHNDNTPSRSSLRLSSPCPLQTYDTYKNTENLNQKATASKKCQGSARQSTITNFPNAKRARRRWTKEEEELLKEGVQSYSTGGNIPWRTILDRGRGVFDDTRTPVDLKDKWKTLRIK